MRPTKDESLEEEETGKLYFPAEMPWQWLDLVTVGLTCIAARIKTILDSGNFSVRYGTTVERPHCHMIASARQGKASWGLGKVS